MQGKYFILILSIANIMIIKTCHPILKYQPCPIFFFLRLFVINHIYGGYILDYFTKRKKKKKKSEKVTNFKGFRLQEQDEEIE